MYQLSEKTGTRSRPFIQTNLKIGRPGDKYEQEAEAVAERVMMMSESDTMQMQPIEEEEEMMQTKLRMQPVEEEEEMIQTMSENGGGVASPDLVHQLNSSKGSGRPLSAETNQFMSNAFGADFSNVNIHADSNAVQMNQQLGAKAFTHGSDIYFNKVEYNPGSNNGKKLLAHELTHVVQQNSQISKSPKIQCDFAVAPTHPDTEVTVLTETQIQNAITFNSVLFTDTEEISVLRDILGITSDPAVIDSDFVNAVLRYQSQYGLSQDGKLGSSTAGILYNEVKAEADYLEQPERGTALRRVERRLFLRSRVPSRSGTIAHQGFVGPDDRPNGVVTVRINANETALAAAADRAISLDYTGNDANNVNWLQFINRSYYGYQPGTDTRTYHNGNITTTGGTYALSQPGAVTWNLDTLSAVSPFYNPAGASERTANRSIAMIDQPGNAPVAMRNAFTTANPGLNRLIMRATFDAYAVLNNRVVYRVRWYATYRSNLVSGAWSVPTVQYSLGTVESRNSLIREQRTVLRGRFAGNTIP